MTLLDLSDIVVRFGATTAVDGVSLRVEPGSITGVVGESGSGKTTLARVITGETAPTSGTVTFDGHPLGARRTTAERRAIQMVFQDPYSSLNPRRTVGSMLGELLRVHRLRSGADVRRRSEELLDLVRLPRTALGAQPGQFSGGQRQRIAIARALAVEPALLVADEPTSALDVSVQTTVLDLFDELRRDIGLTMVFISHDLAVVNRLCDRVAVMHDGRIAEEQPTADLFRAPAADYTRRLLAAAPRLPRAMAGPADAAPAAPVSAPRPAPAPAPPPPASG